MYDTDHTIQPLQCSKSAKRVKVIHNDYDAVQYEFYIPMSVLSHVATRLFLERLQSVENGATVFNGLTGTWRDVTNGKDVTEAVVIYRVTIHGEKFDPNCARRAIHNEVGRLLASLSEWKESLQKEFWFTETSIHVSSSRLK